GNQRPYRAEHRECGLPPASCTEGDCRRVGKEWSGEMNTVVSKPRRGGLFVETRRHNPVLLFFSGAATQRDGRDMSLIEQRLQFDLCSAAAPLKNKRIFCGSCGYKQATPTGFGESRGEGEERLRISSHFGNVFVL